MTYSLAIVKSGFRPRRGAGRRRALLAAKRMTPSCISSPITSSIATGRWSQRTSKVTTGKPLSTCAIPGRRRYQWGALDYVREGLDLLCLERALGIGRCDCFSPHAASRHAQRRGHDLARAQRNRLYEESARAGRNHELSVRLRRPLTMKAISLALDLYRSGALLSLEDPSLGRALWLATSVLSNWARAGSSARGGP